MNGRRADVNREIVLLYVDAHPGCTVREIAGHYACPRARNPATAATAWVRKHLRGLGDRVRAIPQSSPRRYEAAKE